MPLRKALGVGVVILVLSSLLPNVLHQIEATAVSVLHVVETIANIASSSASSAAASPSFAPLFTAPILPSPPGVQP